MRVVSSPANVGFCAAYNRLAAATDGDLLVFLNNDTVPRPEWLGHLVETLASAPPDVAAAAGIAVDWSGERLDFGYGVMTFDGHAFQLDAGRPIDSVTLFDAIASPPPMGNRGGGKGSGPGEFQGLAMIAPGLRG